METKERFLETALDLFARYGYAGVSVRDIAAAMGMRESAMYKHFKSKADVLDQIVARAQTILENFSLAFSNPKGGVREVAGAWFVRIYRIYTQDPFISRFRRFMTISRYEDEASERRFCELFIEKSLRYYERVFRARAEERGVIDADARLMALRLYAPLFLLMNREGADAAEDERLLQTHVEKFFSEYPFLEDDDEI